MNLKEIYHPIEMKLDQVEKEMASVVCADASKHPVNEILNNFFKTPGKCLRPALAMLSAGMINDSLPDETNEQLIKLAVVLELIHSTSLIHDDIIDNDTLRRGQKTLNGEYGRKIAVLAGDVLYARTFSLLTTEMPASFTEEIIKLTENMCAAEIEQAKSGSVTQELYLSVIRGKTAEFMSASCRLGGILAGATQSQVEALSVYGLNLGITYQLIDDIMDGDVDNSLGIDLSFVERYALRALNALDAFENSPYKESLIKFVSYILNFILKLADVQTKNA